MNTQPTPRTDANVKRHNLCRLSGNDLVYADFPRQLERELATVTAQRDRLAKACDQYSEDEILCKLQEITAQRDRLAEIIIRIGWPARGTADDFATVSDFATEIQATWKYEELEALQSLTLKQ